uniref:Uncharacterized protein n=1 Tax=Timema tahoe TaxID=61484 RepID=A0A7R9P000_9NEOP|nr:unnamed protein product [Timema tahoe]
MAAEIKPATGTNDKFNSTKKPILLSKLEGCNDDVNAAIIIPGEDGVISICDDRGRKKVSECVPATLVAVQQKDVPATLVALEQKDVPATRGATEGCSGNVSCCGTEGCSGNVSRGGMEESSGNVRKSRQRGGCATLHCCLALSNGGNRGFSLVRGERQCPSRESIETGVLFGNEYRGELVTDCLENMNCGAVQAVERVGGAACASAKERDKGRLNRRSIGLTVLARQQDASYMRYMPLSAGWQPNTLDFQGNVQATVRVWLKRDSGQYWPSICHYMPAGATALYYCVETRHLFVGIEVGGISEFVLAPDFNRMTHVRTYPAHQARVTDVLFALNCEWVLSVGRDKMFQFHCSETGRRLGDYISEAWCTAVQYP